MIDLSFLKVLDRFSLIVNKHLTSNYVGERRTAFLGRGLVFRDYSTYAPGEDYRMIDWKVYARTDRLMIKKHEEERNLTVHIIADFSASMNFGDPVKKSDYTAMLGIGFAYLAMKNNERFVMSTFAEKLELFKPKKGRKQLAAIVDYLNEKKAKGVTNFEESLGRYKKMIGSRSLVIIVSDFLYDVNEIKSALLRFKNHDVRLIQVLDKSEKELDVEGEVKLKDSESGTMLRTYISPYLKKKYLNLLEVHNAMIRHACLETNAHFYSYATDTPLFDAFYEIVAKT
ncbi:DUF58 domain-containing protein [Candidatus Woesearchaeota archaeon]|nr:DUF58 domain-containing protein [Candidatus Woesearchaeota archaeon]